MPTEIRVQENQRLLEHVNKQLDTLEVLLSTLKDIELNMEKVTDYYYSDWIVDREQDYVIHYPVLNENLVYDSIQSHYLLLKESKKIINEQLQRMDNRWT